MKKTEFRDIIYEALWNVLKEETPKGQPEAVAKDDIPLPSSKVLSTAKDEILGKFPTLKRTLVNMMTPEFGQFVKDVEWVAPKPTTFRVTLGNEQEFTLKWMGKDFQATILGKRYFLSKIDDFQQALDRLNELLRNAPMTPAEDGEEFDNDSSGGGGGGGEFPGEEGGATGGGESAADEFEDEGPSDLPDSDEVDFAEPGEDPDEEL